MRRLHRFFTRDDGTTALEYGLIASLIAVAIVGVMLTFGPKLATTLNGMAGPM